MQHPSYETYGFHDDISLIRLAVPFTKHTYPRSVGTLCLPTGPVKVPNYFVVASGWGRSGAKQPTTSKLKEAILRTVSPDRCRRFYNLRDETFFCAIGVDGSICTGDSGSAVVSNRDGSGRYEADGIVSFGSSSGCDTDILVGFTKVYDYVGWIRDVIENNGA